MSARRASLVALAAAVGLAGCNAILGNDDPSHAAAAGGAGASGAAGAGGADTGGSGGDGTSGSGGVGGTSGSGGVGGGGTGGASGKGGSAGMSGSSGQGGTGGKGGSNGKGGGSGKSGGGGVGGGGMGGVGGVGGSGGVGGAGAGGSTSSTCAVVYVATAADGGLDTNDGCDPAAPIATVQGALSTVKAKAGDGMLRELHVCRGTYHTGGILLDAPFKIRGGYKCGATWDQQPPFDSTYVTTFDNPDATLAADALAIAAPASVIGPTSLLEQVKLQGALTGTVSNAVAPAALHISGGASPIVKSCEITGGGTTNMTGAGSAGLLLESSSPTVDGCHIKGGTGKTTAGSKIGSIGISMLDASAPHIASNLIGGGTGLSLSGSGSMAVFANLDGTSVMTTATGNAFENNKLDGGGNVAVGAGATSAMRMIGPAMVDLIGNDFDAGKGAPTAGQSSEGLLVASLNITTNIQSLRIMQNRIYGGDGACTHLGLSVLRSSHTEIVNNEIHSGNSAGLASDDTASAALSLRSGKDTSVRHNTFIVARANVPWPAMVIAANQVGVTVENNVFLGAAQSSLAISETASPCGGNAIASLKSNVFVNWDAGLLSCSATTYSTIATTEMALGVKASQNTNVGANCALADACHTSVGCGTPDACIQTLVQHWTAADQGHLGMFLTFAPFGFALDSKAPCGLVASPDDDSMTVPVDLNGAMRTPTT